jgi:hypothetical protein
MLIEAISNPHFAASNPLILKGVKGVLKPALAMCDELLERFRHKQIYQVFPLLPEGAWPVAQFFGLFDLLLVTHFQLPADVHIVIILNAACKDVAVDFNARIYKTTMVKRPSGLVLG